MPYSKDDLSSYYDELNHQCLEVMNITLEENAEDHAKSHSFVKDLHDWIDIIDNRYESEILRVATYEYQFALLTLVQGHYRQAFMTLRLFFELSISCVYFSTNELEFREWQNNRKDIVWNEITYSENHNKGIFTKRFAEAFCPDVAEVIIEFANQAKDVYRQCSEYVHGNIHTHHELGGKLTYNYDLFNKWHSLAKIIRNTLSFILFVRYSSILSDSDKERLENHLRDELNHIQVIRNLLSWEQ